MLIALLISIGTIAQASTVETIQPYAEEQRAAVANTQLQFVNLNSHVNSWYLLRIKGDRSPMQVINLQNAGAPQVRLRLNPENATILEFFEGKRLVDTCPDFINAVQSQPARSRPFASLCGDKVFVRNKANGYQPSMEKTVQFLREYFGSAGEAVINGAKATIFDDKYTENPEFTKGDAAKEVFESKALKAALVDKQYTGRAITNHRLGIVVAPGKATPSLNVGQWYSTAKFPNVYVSLMTAGMASEEILKSHPDRVRQPLGSGEANALVYLVAFDMKKFTMGWAHGTQQPGIGWSERVGADKIKTFGGGAGPDGVDSFGDLVNPGQVPPHDIPKTVATISGGFQLKHSHFRWGKYAGVNKSTHFGFIDNGVVMAKPNPGLSTIFVRVDGSFEMKTWTEADVSELPKIRYLRQNNLPLVEPDASGRGIPGDHVTNLQHGNWSGSAEGNLYTPRGAACKVEAHGEEYFVYAYFSAATPASMARVFQAYGCKQGIHLDMNSPGQAYLALMGMRNDGRLDTQPLTTDMAEVHPRAGIPRYLAIPDFRDFFWIMRK